MSIIESTSPGNLARKCYACAHNEPYPGDAHRSCRNTGAGVIGYPHGIDNGWFTWPFNFDPCWLMRCDGCSLTEACLTGMDNEEKAQEKAAAEEAKPASGEERPSAIPE